MLLGACGGMPGGVESAANRAMPALPTDSAALRAQGLAALNAGDHRGAILALSEATARAPRDAELQTLLGLAYHNAGERDPEAIELAIAGYDLALKSQPGNFWAAALAGRAAYDRGRYDEATRRFGQAVLARPGDPRALMALAQAAYMNGDAVLAAVSAERAADRFADAPERAGALRLAALAEAASGDGARGNALVDAVAILDPAGARALAPRVAQLAQTAPVDGAGVGDGASEAPVAPNQISVDVAIVLAQNTSRERIGINLLDGLSLQYGYSRADSRRISRGDNGNTNTLDRVITEAIGIPQLTYNLNLFNRGGQNYQVVARPTLTAYSGETSEFFVGRTLKVAVSGINAGQLESIDIGIELKVTPVEITPDGTRVRIETGRSFLTADAAGNFNEALTTFRQRVSATAELRFGETLVLSGLSESVDDATYSKTPVLGEVPLIGSLFNERAKQSRRDAVLILVTPSRPAALPGRAWARAEAVERLATLWTEIVDPSSNGVDAARRLKGMRMFTRMAPGDSPLAWPSPRKMSGEMLGELLAP
ncbi:tetratricopeptide repeat protein [Sphingomonas canadensis]|uniref:Tetratricopeptide repeat protein n=1 Tax=Sphingomonas canadensis TaxID=1219257 RepID=A0ABW3H1I0_9SPHN|nr:tetratricopeptide repeat protein [Sphingomonas canadensis]MCW3835075.1 tetratricopeptide repeat protein [Sphingomonas canadensis]